MSTSLKLSPPTPSSLEPTKLPDQRRLTRFASMSRVDRAPSNRIGAIGHKETPSLLLLYNTKRRMYPISLHYSSFNSLRYSKLRFA